MSMMRAFKNRSLALLAVCGIIFFLIASQVSAESDLPVGLQKIVDSNKEITADFALNVSFFIAFIAGILGILSPCILPFLPAYFSYTFKEKSSITKMTLVFFLGFSTVFVAMGIVAGFIGAQTLSVIQQGWLVAIAGAFMIVLGIMTLFGKKVCHLIDHRQFKKDIPGTFLFGMFFAVGWTACLGPILAGILSIGAILGNIWYSAVLLFFYSLGNLVPLFILSIIYDKSNISQSRFIQGKTFEISIAGKRYHFNSTNIISGLLFLIIGTVLLVYKGTSIVNKFDIFGTKQYFYSIQRQFIVWKHADALGVAVFALFIAAIVLFFWKSRKGRINGTEFVKNRYDYYSKFYDIFEFFPEMLFRRWRKKYIALLKGSILEVGVGTGKNLQYYSKESKVTGIDFSSKMLAKAIKESNRLKSDHSLLQMDAQRLQFKDNTFDSVLCTFVLCSVPNPVRALKEMKRVCKPNGNIMIIEHVLSKNRLIAFFQRIHNPITLFLFGFNITRDTVSNIKKAGLKIMTEKNLTSNDVFKLVICRPGGKD